MTVHGDRCLVKLAPRPQVSHGGIVIAAEEMPVPVCYGKVMQAGPKCQDVAPGDVIAFSPESGDDAGKEFLVPHVFLREREVMAVIERTE